MDLTPLLPFAPRWRLYFDFRFLDFLPVCAQCRPAALLKALHHRTSRVIVRVCENLLEKRIDRTIATNIRILFHSLFLVAGEDIGGDTLPILLLVTDRNF